MKGVKNVIFDLGGVLLNIDFKKATSAFKNLGIQNFETYFSQSSAAALFQELETGKISNEDFCNTFRSLTGANATNDDIFFAWNSLLLNFPERRFEFLKQIKNAYRIYLFSNTNKIHYDAFLKIFSEAFQEDFNRYFIKAYYSHNIGFRKPYKEAYEFVVKDAGIKAGETLFIDDTLVNIEGAAEAGLKTFWLKPPLEIWDIDL